MDKITIDKMISDKIDTLKNSYRKDSGFDYLKQIVKNNKFGTVQGFVNSDVYEIYKGMYYLRVRDYLSFEEICDRVDNYKEFLQLISPSSLILLKAVCQQILDTDNLDRVLMYYKINDSFKEKLLLSNMKGVDNYGKDVIRFFKEEIKGNSFTCFLWFLEDLKDDNRILDLIEMIALQASLESQLDTINDAKEIYAEIMGTANADSLDKILNDKFKISHFFDDIGVVKEFVVEEEAKERKYKKYTIKEIEALEKASLELNNVVNEEEITCARRISNSIYDFDIKYAVLEFIYEHNNKYYEKLDKEIDRLKNSSIDSYKELLSEYGIECDNFDLGALKLKSLEDVEEIIKTISKYNFSNSMMLYILSNASKERVLLFDDFIARGIIPTSFLSINLDLYLEESNKTKMLNDNINSLVKYDINPKLFYNSIFILMYDSNLFGNNLEILNRYDLLKYLKTTDSYELLISDKLDEKIDLFLELGYEELLKTNLGLLNSNNLNRLYVIKELDIDIKDSMELKDLLSNDKRFFISDNKLDLYIPDGVRDKDKENNDLKLDDLEEYKISKRLYSFGDELVSYNKVKKNVNDGMNIYDSIFSNMHLTNEQINRVYNSLNNKKLVKKDNN